MQLLPYKQDKLKLSSNKLLHVHYSTTTTIIRTAVKDRL